MNINVRILAAIFICCLGTSLLLAAIPEEVKKALSKGAEAKITFRVVDSNGNPVDKASVLLGFWNPNNGRDPGVKGLTDANGLFAATGNPVNEVNYQFIKDGYYKTEGKYVVYRANDTNTVKDGRWQPWNPTNTVVLKEKRHPVPMYAKSLEIEMPVQNVPAGFDLEKGDWVAPYGKGGNPDILIRYSNTNTGPGALNYSRQLEITFDNTNDGILVLPVDGNSILHSLYEAPENGYSHNLLLQEDMTTFKIIKQVELDANHYAIFRVRSVADGGGNIVSANYGKLYGPIQYGVLSGHHIIFKYYFNPDGTRNLEFDPKQNLFKNLSSLERVTAP